MSSGFSADAAVLRGVPRPAKTLSTAERIDLDPQPVHHGQVQAGGRTRVLPPVGGGAKMDDPGTRTADRRRAVRADGPVANRTLGAAERFAPRRRGLQGHVPPRIP